LVFPNVGWNTEYRRKTEEKEHPTDEGPADFFENMHITMVFPTNLLNSISYEKETRFSLILQ
jgi:hypothetical protein